MDLGQQGEVGGQAQGEERGDGRGDLLFAPIVILLGIGVIFLSFQMPRPEGWVTAPGVFPLLSGIILLGLGIGFFVSTIRKNKSHAPQHAKEVDQEESRIFVKRTLVAVVSILIYICVLIPSVHFTIGTFVYLVGTLWYFWRGKIYKILLISIFTTLFLSAVFKYLFQIILP